VSPVIKWIHKRWEGTLTVCPLSAFACARFECSYIILSSLRPQYGGQKAIDTHRYKLLQLVLSGDATPLYNAFQYFRYLRDGPVFFANYRTVLRITTWVIRKTVLRITSAKIKTSWIWLTARRYGYMGHKHDRGHTVSVPCTLSVFVTGFKQLM